MHDDLHPHGTPEHVDDMPLHPGRELDFYINKYGILPGGTLKLKPVTPSESCCYDLGAFFLHPMFLSMLGSLLLLVMVVTWLALPGDGPLPINGKHGKQQAKQQGNMPGGEHRKQQQKRNRGGSECC